MKKKIVTVVILCVVVVISYTEQLKSQTSIFYSYDRVSKIYEKENLTGAIESLKKLEYYGARRADFVLDNNNSFEIILDSLDRIVKFTVLHDDSMQVHHNYYYKLRNLELFDHQGKGYQVTYKISRNTRDQIQKIHKNRTGTYPSIDSTLYFYDDDGRLTSINLENEILHTYRYYRDTLDYEKTESIIEENDTIITFKSRSTYSEVNKIQYLGYSRESDSLFLSNSGYIKYDTIGRKIEEEGFRTIADKSWLEFIKNQFIYKEGYLYSVKRTKKYSEASQNSTSIYERDSLGRVLKVIHKTDYPKIEGRILNFMDNGDIVQDYKYDQFGNVIEINSSNSGIQRFIYEYDDQNNWIIKYTYKGEDLRKKIYRHIVYRE